MKPYENNPRNNADAVAYVANSIKEFGFRAPIIVDENNVIIAGHTRFLAAGELELKEVPCLVANDLTPEQVKAYRIADNKIAEHSTWENDLLAMELQELNAFNFDFESIGFDEWEIDTLLNPVTENDLQEYFEDKQKKEKEPKKIICPHCGKEVEV